MQPFIQLLRLRVMQGTHVAYDHEFHAGINIIRGRNGSGKSTIADFIFFVLGGHFDDWKDAASKCSQVQAEVNTPNGRLVLRRDIGSAQEPLLVYFGTFDSASNVGVDGWERFPLHRTKAGKESFSQVLFRSIGIPETQSEGASNITIHQLLRLCYSDQRTPAGRLFRFEGFDTQAIREAVGDLICGVKGYELFELVLALRDVEKELELADSKIKSLIRSLRFESALDTPESIAERIRELGLENTKLSEEIARVDEYVAGSDVAAFEKERAQLRRSIAERRNKITKKESEVESLEYDLREISDFLDFLEYQRERLKAAERAADVIGPLQYSHCPACGKQLDNSAPAKEGQCHVCKTQTDNADKNSAHNQIRLDLEIQSRESRQLQTAKKSTLAGAAQDLQRLRSAHRQSLIGYEAKYSGGNGPREAYLAERTRKQGEIGVEIKYLTANLEIAEEIRALSQEKALLQEKYDRMKNRAGALRGQSEKRRLVALSGISDIGRNILKADLPRQEEFVCAESMEVDFRNDSMTVGGKANFAESSNVVLKNTAVLSIFLAAMRDNKFLHPGLVLFDNVEDKGMTEDRSRNFQKLIVETATEIERPYQVIFTTSMMCPELEHDDYVIGPAYTEQNRTLDLRSS